MAKKTLYRSKSNKVIAGVCGGIGEYLDIDPTVIRLLWVIITIPWGFGVIAYIICMFIIPEEPAGKSVKKVKESPKAEILEHEGKIIGGLIMVLIGTILLANNLGLFSMFPWLSWNYVWPFILIGIGAILLIAPKGRCRRR